MSRRFSCAVALGLLTAAMPTFAQTARPERPYRGLFASGGGNAEQTLTASATIASGWDDNLLAAARGGENALPDRRNPARGGAIANLTGALTYSLQRDGINLNAGATTATRYLPSLAHDFVRASQGRLSLSGSPRPGTTLVLSASAAHQPRAYLSLFPSDGGAIVGASEVLDLDATASPEVQLSYGGNASASQQLTRRTSVSANYLYHATERPGAVASFRQQRVGGQLSHQLGSGLVARAGYGYGEGRSTNGESYPLHHLDIGLGFNRALSLTRRTTLSFSTGSTATRSREQLRFHVTGDAQLTHEIGRTWAAWTAYGRHVQFHETWSEPGLGNSLTFGFGGLASRRVQINTTARVAVGTVGVESGAPGFDHYYGTASLSYALTRFVNTSLSYGYYRHHFDEGVPLADGLARTLDRHSLRVGINLWAPVFQRARRTDAPR